MIPISTTTITVYMPAPPDLDAEPYSGNDTTASLQVRAGGVRAVIDRPNGREQLAGGEQAVWDFELVCDNCDLDRLDTVHDDTTGVDYRVVWLWNLPGDHMEAGLRLVQGEV